MTYYSRRPVASVDANRAHLVLLDGGDRHVHVGCHPHRRPIGAVDRDRGHPVVEDGFQIGDVWHPKLGELALRQMANIQHKRRVLPIVVLLFHIHDHTPNARRPTVAAPALCDVSVIGLTQTFPRRSWCRRDAWRTLFTTENTGAH